MLRIKNFITDHRKEKKLHVQKQNLRSSAMSVIVEVNKRK